MFYRKRINQCIQYQYNTSQPTFFCYRMMLLSNQFYFSSSFTSSNRWYRPRSFVCWLCDVNSNNLHFVLACNGCNEEVEHFCKASFDSRLDDPLKLGLNWMNESIEWQIYLICSANVAMSLISGDRQKQCTKIRNIQQEIRIHSLFP